MTIQQVASALPGAPAAIDQVLLRAAIVSGLAHFIEPDTNPTTYDPAVSGGAVAWLVAWHEKFWWLDPLDTTTAHDGTTCIVLSGGGRYKVGEIDPWHGYAVLAQDVETPPDPEDENEEDRPALGDAYLVPDAASGEWGDHADEIAIWTARGWGYVLPRKGRQIYVEDASAYLHWNGTAWIEGLGNNAHADNSIAPVKLVQGVTKWIVEAIGTNTPPGIVKGVNYIVGGSPTGAFAGHTNKIATSDDGLAWDFYTPSEGWEVYDRATNSLYRFDGTAWGAFAGAVIDQHSVSSTASSAITDVNASGYNYSNSSAPTTGRRRNIDAGTAFSFTAKTAGNILEFEWAGDVALDCGTSGIGFGDLVAALFIDSQTSAADWQRINLPMGLNGLLTANNQVVATHVRQSFRVAAADASAHTYRVAFISKAQGAGNNTQHTDVNALGRRRFSVKEIA
jgi:hypothetical protein